jgi:hypothetical protein
VICNIFSLSLSFCLPHKISITQCCVYTLVHKIYRVQCFLFSFLYILTLYCRKYFISSLFYSDDEEFSFHFNIKNLNFKKFKNYSSASAKFNKNLFFQFIFLPMFEYHYLVVSQVFIY